MNDIQKNTEKRLQALSIQEARKQIAEGHFGIVGGPDHRFALDCLTAREAEERSQQEAILENLTAQRHAQIHDRLVELKKPHWSLTPAFIVAVLAMLFAAIAAWPVIRGWFQPSPDTGTASPRQSQPLHLEPRK